MTLSMEVSIGPGHIVLDGDPPTPTERGTALLLFGQCLLRPNGRPFPQLLSSCHYSLNAAHLCNTLLIKARWTSCSTVRMRVKLCSELNYQLSLMNPRDALHHGDVLQTKVDAQCDKFVTELS